MKNENTNYNVNYFKDAGIVVCLETGKPFLYNEEYLKSFWDFSNIQVGKPSIRVVQMVMGGVIFKEPDEYAEILKTKEDCKKYTKSQR